MTNEELLKPRFKMIANYPLSELKIGDVLQRSNNLFYIGIKDEDDVHVWMTEKDISEYPHLFQKLYWWEGRNEKELPTYIKVDWSLDGKKSSVAFWKIQHWDINSILSTIDNKGYGVSSAIKCMLPSTEEEYLKHEKIKPTDNKKMELKDLIGLHDLSGVDTTTEKYKDWSGSESDREVVRFVLDGKTYKATEDPSDGYRSYLGDIEVCHEVISNNFTPQKVFAKMKENGSYSVNDTIQFIDAITGKIVLEVGTDNTDDYYPYCVMSWNPQNLAINIGK